MKLLQSDLKNSGVPSHLASGLLPLIGVLREQGVDWHAILKHSGVSVGAFNSPGHRITPGQELTFTEGAIKAVNQADLGLVLGNRYHLSSYGVLGLAAMTSSSLLKALELFAKYYLMCGTYFAFCLEVQAGQVTISAEGQRDLGLCYRYMADRDICASYTSVCQILGRGVPLLGVSFVHEAPAYAKQYEEVFGCPVQFGADRLAYQFEESYLLEQPPQRAPESFQLFHGQCIKAFEELTKGASYSETCRQHLLEEPDKVSSLDLLAERLHASPRSIQRKLAAEGTSYKKVLDDVRKNLAVEYLQTNSMSLSEIALRLGYSEAPNFITAYKRWTGMTPGESRQQY